MKNAINWNDPDGVRFAEIPIYSRSRNLHHRAVDRLRRKLVADLDEKWGPNPRWQELADSEIHYQWRHTQKVGYFELRAHHDVIKGYRWASLEKQARTERKAPRQIEWVGKFAEIGVYAETGTDEIVNEVLTAINREMQLLPRERFVDINPWIATARFVDWRAFFDKLAEARPVF